MLESLSIKNIALIDSLNLDFKNGFNVLTGESGAGKSILIGSISFLLGGKSSVDIIRNGAEEASVSGVFSISKDNKKAREWLQAHDVEMEEDLVLIRRSIKQNGRSSIWILGVPFSKGELAEFTSYLIDIHGQHEHQSLFRISEHRRFLDGFAGIEEKVHLFTKLYAELAALREEYSSFLEDERARKDRAELLSFAIEEIEKAQLKDGEEEKLIEEERRLSQFEKLVEAIQEILQVLQKDSGAVSLLRRAKRLLEDAKEMDGSLKEYASRLDNIFYEAEDISDVLSSYYSGLNFSGEILDEVQARLSLISRLEKKYGSSIKDILFYCENAKKELSKTVDVDERKRFLSKEIKLLESRLLELGRDITKIRCENKLKLQEEVVSILKTLGMKSSRFVVSIITREEHNGQLMATPYGFDEVEFLISANEGEKEKSLAKIASGGELSRVMLALKTVLSSNDEVETLIFDEIDVGIGGEVALNVANHIRKLSNKKQILLITHLAIIAAFADNHVKVEKSFENGATFTNAFCIEDDRRVEEVARMLSGDKAGDASLAHALELLRRYSSNFAKC